MDILAPVGNLNMLKAAVFSGADSVYCGLKDFNARQSADNFDAEELKCAVQFCHARNVKVNVTLNTLLYDAELPAFLQSLQTVCEAGADAVIVQDLAAAQLVREAAPSIALHGSTQMAVHTLEGALQLKQLGFSRVILARELDRKQIAAITKNSGMETEIFVHGALCISLSGQCYMSAFLGGRSGNRGRCAGTCRLPFRGEDAILQGEQYALSLKDLSLTEYLKEIEETDVSCIKIEGRMRTPEYVAVAVNACKNVLDDKPFNEELLEGVFSRSGFTDGFYTNNIPKDMFGTRTQQNMADTKQTLPKVRELYRRELQKVPVDFTLTFSENELILQATTNNETMQVKANLEVQTALKDPTEAYRKSLAKTGGTPFYAKNITIENQGNVFVQSAVLNDLRSEVLTTLLQKRERHTPHAFYEERALQSLHADRSYFKKEQAPLTFTVRLASVSQLPEGLLKENSIEKFVFPLKEFVNIPEEIKAKAVLELPRSMFEGADSLRKEVKKTQEFGFTAFEAGNIGHIPLLQGTQMHGGFSLNITNTVAAAEYAELGLQSAVLSPEIPLQNIGIINAGANLKTGIIGYGHLPLMLTRACPVEEAEEASDTQYLTDRKNVSFTVQYADGAYHIYNPIPLYMADRLHEVPCGFVTLYFTSEPRQAVEEIFYNFKQRKPYDKPFTRGLYYKGAQ